ncbi:MULTISPECIES: hypothetical protein [Achromobacter]|uniref:Uncharacterized protein n=1 Tax=Achromobacter aegrifaciens TaxID=1287736 RepID=A0AAD2J447_ACHAE|nr:MULTISPECIES: hypothetical protein [Achromobacter]PTN49012.1 hypothetical protein DAI43_26345 [Achromobacter xylosoxidans]MBD9432516.1 hypothetical protein [Achromobacter sp. ACM03]MDQ1759678.1 hypothetical protein [Achromobacter aegrifaciens]CAB3696604.1 hypothetical protein LMG26852_04944 [Achromobacter aegrifaciens]CAB3854455.1 hypothetical protein LMG3410_01947 [Achromobacter aegrifaciens]
MTQPPATPSAQRQPSRRLANLLFYVCLAISLTFVYLGSQMIRDGADAGIPVTLFFGVCAATAVLQIWPQLLQRDSRSAATLLARYPGPLELKAAKGKLLAFSLLSAGFGGVILWMLLQESLPPLKQLILWPGAAFFLLGAVMLLVRAAKDDIGLRLGRDGFQARQVWNGRTIRWQDTSEFNVIRASRAVPKLIVFDDAAVERSGTAGLNKHFVGRNSSLGETYGLTHEALADLLNAWRKRALEQDAIFTRWPDNQ